MYKLRDKAAKDAGMELIVIKTPRLRKVNPFDHGALHTDMWKTEGLKQALDKHGFDAAFGVRVGMKKNRAPERVASFRTAQHRWELAQRPELGRSIMRAKPRGKHAFFHCPTGRNWTSGNTSI